MTDTPIKAMKKPKREKLVLDVWPQLVGELRRHRLLGDTPEDVAKYLLVKALEPMWEKPAVTWPPENNDD